MAKTALDILRSQGITAVGLTPGARERVESRPDRQAPRGGASIEAMTPAGRVSARTTGAAISSGKFGRSAAAQSLRLAADMRAEQPDKPEQPRATREIDEALNQWGMNDRSDQYVEEQTNDLVHNQNELPSPEQEAQWRRDYRQVERDQEEQEEFAKTQLGGAVYRKRLRDMVMQHSEIADDIAVEDRYLVKQDISETPLKEIGYKARGAYADLKKSITKVGKGLAAAFMPEASGSVAGGERSARDRLRNVADEQAARKLADKDKRRDEQRAYDEAQDAASRDRKAHDAKRKRLQGRSDEAETVLSMAEESLLEHQHTGDSGTQEWKTREAYLQGIVDLRKTSREKAQSELDKFMDEGRAEVQPTGVNAPAPAPVSQEDNFQYKPAPDVLSYPTGAPKIDPANPPTVDDVIAGFGKIAPESVEAYVEELTKALPNAYTEEQKKAIVAAAVRRMNER